MAALVEIDESNGAVETITDGITVAYYGSVDAANLDPTLVANSIAVSANSYEKWWRWHCTDLNGASALVNLRVWAEGSPATGGAHTFNGSTVQATYDPIKQTTYSQPLTTATRATQTMPTSDPGLPNIGIGGSLTGSLGAGRSDYLVSQIQLSGAAVTGTTYRLVLAYDELA